MVKKDRHSQNFSKISNNKKKSRFFYSKIRSFMVGTKIKFEILENFVKNRRNLTNFGNFSLSKKHHPVRREPAAVLARALFFVTFWKNHRNPPNFGNFSRKKISKFLYQNWIVHGWYKNQKMSKILEILSNFARNEILVFFVLKVPQDAMFDKNRFFQTFSSFSKVRVKKRTIKLLMTGQWGWAFRHS